jgi:hypothetical protein
MAAAAETMLSLNLGNNRLLVDNPPATLPVEACLDNVWLIGQTGKTTLLDHIAFQLASMGYNFCFIDPLSTSVPFLLHNMPKSWGQDVVYLHSLSDDIIPWNPLHDLADNPQDVINEMLFLLESLLAQSFMHHSQQLFRMGAFALAGIPEANLLHLSKLMTDDDWRRRRVVPTITDPRVRSFWKLQFQEWIKNKRRDDKIAAIQNKLDIL